MADTMTLTRNEWRADLLKRYRSGSEGNDSDGISRRLSVTERVARVIGDDVEHPYDEAGDTQKFYLMIQATMFIDDVIETDGVFPGLDTSTEKDNDE